MYLFMIPFSLYLFFYLDGGIIMDIKLLEYIDNLVWGPPLIILLVGVGIFLTFRLGLIQIFKLPRALKLILSAKNTGKGDISSFKALCLALSATVGTGNIVGVATAIQMGGPGAIFWMWIAAFFGMATKYAEGLLAIKYRSKDKLGQVAGGPMYYIELGMGKKYKPLAVLFAFFCILVSFFGIGTFAQVNAIVDSIALTFNVPIYISTIILTTLVFCITLGGVKSIARTAATIVPFMAFFYFVVCGGIILAYFDKIPAALLLIIDSAFNGQAAMGGFLGATFMMAIQNGIARGVFSNESGLGSAPIAAAAAKTKWPAEQGLISMTGTFIDTIIICTMTGLALTLTGVWQGTNFGAAMTNSAFTSMYGSIGGIFLTISLSLFAFTTILGWNYYGERASQYLFGIRGILPFKLIFVALIASGAYLKLEAIWLLADIVNGLMAIPNLIALLFLSKVVVEETNKYYNHLKENRNLK